MMSSLPSLSRRTFLSGGVSLIAEVVFANSRIQDDELKASVSGAAFRQAGSSAKISTKTLRENISIVSGSGGNILLCHGPDGNATVDSGLATSRRQVSAAIHEVSPRPLRHLLNTHWHFDHTDGNLWMHSVGATIVAHRNTRARMSSRQVIPAFSLILNSSPQGALPTLIFDQRQELRLNGQKIAMERYTPAHTDSDVSVFFEEVNVIHTGDTWFNGYYPFIDYDSGGSIHGLITASGENLNRTDDQTLVVPGHGAVGNRSDLLAYREMLVAVSTEVERLKKRGYSLEEVIKAKPSASYDTALGSGFVGPALFCELVYRGV
jgi:glyoxylase-like metal-dependent hydrolase (beta-lactamase superfamily II)